MITITDSGGGSFTFVKNGITSIIQKALVTSIREVVDSVFIICKGGKTYKVDNYTEVSGQASAEALVEFIEGIVNGACPTITLSDLTSSISYKSVAYSDSAAASGGTGPYNYAITSGSLPGGLSLNANTGAITGTPTTFGESDTFRITATDSEGCTGIKEYTIVVWAMFTKAGSSFSALNSQVTFDNISGLPASLGTGVAIASLETNASVSGATMADMSCIFYDIGENAVLSLFNDSQLSGTALTNTVISVDGVGLISAGTPPYTSIYSDSQVSGSFSDFDGLNPNDGFTVNLHQQIGSGSTGGIITGTIILKPI